MQKGIRNETEQLNLERGTGWNYSGKIQKAHTSVDFVLKNIWYSLPTL